MTTLQASELTQEFSSWRDRLQSGPIEIMDRGRPSAYVVSPEMFNKLWLNFRMRASAGDLTDEDLELIAKAEVDTEFAFNLTDIPEDDADTASSEILG